MVCLYTNPTPSSKTSEYEPVPLSAARKEGELIDWLRFSFRVVALYKFWEKLKYP